MCTHGLGPSRNFQESTYLSGSTLRFQTTCQNFSFLGPLAKRLGTSPNPSESEDSRTLRRCGILEASLALRNAEASWNPPLCPQTSGDSWRSQAWQRLQWTASSAQRIGPRHRPPLAVWNTKRKPLKPTNRRVCPQKQAPKLFTTVAISQTRRSLDHAKLSLLQLERSPTKQTKFNIRQQRKKPNKFRTVVSAVWPSYLSCSQLWKTRPWDLRTLESHRWRRLLQTTFVLKKQQLLRQRQQWQQPQQPQQPQAQHKENNKNHKNKTHRTEKT